jgi:uroporphyrinogen decarboxylase
VIGIDWHLPLGPSWERVGHHRPVQGNLDPTALLAPWRELKVRVDEVLDGAGGRPGHIFNVGHGILKDTPVDSVRRLVEYVAETTSSRRVVA